MKKKITASTKCPLTGKHRPIAHILNDLAAQEGADGPPYDQMFFASQYIDILEGFVEEVRLATVVWKQDAKRMKRDECFEGATAIIDCASDLAGMIKQHRETVNAGHRR